MADNIDKVRVLLLGDSGVGKTCLAHLIAQHEVLCRPDWTVGCNIEVKLHVYNKGSNQEKLYFVELFDIGGSLSHKMARNVFYTPHNGIILVHDLTNRKSHENLREWIYEVLEREGKDTIKSIISSSGSSVSSPTLYSPPAAVSSSYLLFRKNIQMYHNFSNKSNDNQQQQQQQQQQQHCKGDDLNEGNGLDPEEFIGLTQVPILVIGTKVDLLDERSNADVTERTGGIAEQCGAEEIYLDCHKSDSLSSDKQATEKLVRFFNKVIEKKLSSNESSYYYGRSSQITERRPRFQLSNTSTNAINNEVNNRNWKNIEPI